SIGTRCSSSWTDAAGVELLRINFHLEGASRSELFLCITGARSAEGKLLSHRVQLATLQRPHGGNKFLFLCPGKRPHTPCRQQVRKLYFIEGNWLCRDCRNLTYVARRQHDSRKDHLLRDPSLLLAALQSDDIRQRLLGIGAFAQALARIQRYRH